MGVDEIMNLTLDAILSDGLDDATLNPHAMIALAMKLQGAASILIARGIAALASTATTAPPEPKPESDHLIAIKDAAARLSKHRSWLDRHGRRLGIIVCDPITGRALGCSERGIRRFIDRGTTDASPPRTHAPFIGVDELRAQEAMRRE